MTSSKESGGRKGIFDMFSWGYSNAVEGIAACNIGVAVMCIQHVLQVSGEKHIVFLLSLSFVIRQQAVLDPTMFFKICMSPCVKRQIRVAILCGFRSLYSSGLELICLKSARNL